MPSYPFRIEFTTGDGLYHVGAFYQINLTFTPTNLDLTWNTTYSGVGGNPWVITNNGRSLRFNVEDSENCGGSNPDTQSGQATTTIEIPETDLTKIKLRKGKVILKDEALTCLCCPLVGLLARGTSQDLNQECAMGPVISEFIKPPPYYLSPELIMTLSFEGIGELQDTGFENIAFYLDPVIP